MGNEIAIGPIEERLGRCRETGRECTEEEIEIAEMALIMLKKESRKESLIEYYRDKKSSYKSMQRIMRMMSELGHHEFVPVLLETIKESPEWMKKAL